MLNCSDDACCGEIGVCVIGLDADATVLELLMIGSDW
jgi:hypothetical protein